uniref:Uncharacterized protein n=1 Tax=Arundo donax TaxID=35708 RepID=A0A0A9CH72_ARUDO
MRVVPTCSYVSVRYESPLFQLFSARVCCALPSACSSFLLLSTAIREDRPPIDVLMDGFTWQSEI